VVSFALLGDRVSGSWLPRLTLLPLQLPITFKLLAVGTTLRKVPRSLPGAGAQCPELLTRFDKSPRPTNVPTVDTGSQTQAPKRAEHLLRACAESPRQNQSTDHAAGFFEQDERIPGLEAETASPEPTRRSEDVGRYRVIEARRTWFNILLPGVSERLSQRAPLLCRG
jgi:hypothetical protein